MELNFVIAAICDDEHVFRKQLENFLIFYKRDRRMHLDIIEFSDGQSLLEYDKNFDIVFLDYNMPCINGMNVARELRKRKNISCIVFISNYPEYVFESFEVDTYRYLVKPIDWKYLERTLDNYVIEKKMLSPVIINTGGEQFVINSEDIIYLEGDGKYCIVRTNKNIYRSSKTISAIFELLPNHCFFRIHKSYVVNFYCISMIKESHVILNNGEKAKISRYKLSEFKKAYRAFVRNFISRM